MDTIEINDFMETIFKLYVIEERINAKQEWSEAINEGSYYGRDKSSHLKEECDRLLNNHSSYLDAPPESPYHILSALRLCIRRYIVDGKSINLTDNQFIQDFIFFISFLYEKHDDKKIYNIIFSAFDQKPEELEYFELAFRRLIRCFEMLQLSRSKQTAELKKLLNSITTKAVMENYLFWYDTKSSHEGDIRYKNIFKDVSESQFLKMVQKADFSELNIRGHRQRLLYNIYILTRILGKEWGENAAKNLGTTLAECQKRIEFEEQVALTRMFQE